MKEETKAWIEAGKLFALDGNAKFTCPDCGKGFLKSIDTEQMNDGSFERRIYCELCGSKNYMRLHRK